MTTSSKMTRNMLFISHANPEDNDFTRWLALQLAKDGHPIWCDLTEFGGERFWDNAEQAIRTRTVRFLYVLSRTSNHKKGSRDELQTAFNVARDENLPDFVIPIHIDDLPHREINVQLASITAISFEKSWAGGYNQLLQVLERSGVARSPRFTPSAMTAWWRAQFSASRGIRQEPNICTSNWLAISSMPPCLHLHTLTRNRTGLMELSTPPPHAAFMDGIDLVTFAPAEDFAGQLNEFSVVGTRCFKIADILGDSDALQHDTRGMAKRWIVRLLTDSWNRWIASKELARYEMSHGECCFFKKPPESDSLSLGFARLDGRQGKPRGVVGYKTKANKSKRYWHFGLQAKPMFHPQLLFSVSSHVVFSDDGKTPWDSADRMHRARRRQCKNWQNDEWRDKLLATLNWLSSGEAVLQIPVGRDLRVQVCSRPLEFLSPLAYTDPPKRTKSPAMDLEAVSVDHEQDDEGDEDDRDDEEE